MSIEAMKQWLEALEENQPINYCLNNNGEKFPMFSNDPLKQERNEKAITSLRQAIADAEKQEQGEPVAWTGGYPDLMPRRHNTTTTQKQEHCEPTKCCNHNCNEGRNCPLRKTHD